MTWFEGLRAWGENAVKAKTGEYMVLCHFSYCTPLHHMTSVSRHISLCHHSRAHVAFDPREPFDSWRQVAAFSKMPVLKG